MTVHYCIIGNGVAGTTAVESLRQADADGRITVISEEPYPFYSRPLISYLLAGEVEEDRLWIRPDDFYERMNVEALLGTRVTNVEAGSRELHLSDGSTVAYDRLLLACGGRPIVPPLQGRELAGVFTFTTLDEARQLDSYLKEQEPRRAVVLGAGLIGLKTAEALIARGLEITLVELADRVLSATLDERASDLIRAGLAEVGAEVLTGTTIGKVEGSGGRVARVVLEDGSELPADLVVLAIGVRPAIGFLDGAVECGRGVLVNEFLETSAEGVFAAGDVVEGYDITFEAPRVVATWMNAARQGRTAGQNMTGAREPFEGSLGMNAVEIAGVATISMGLTTPDPETRSRDLQVLEEFDPREQSYRKVVLEGGRVVGGIFVGSIDRAGIFTGLIRSRTDVGAFRDRLLAPDFGLVWLPKEYRKHVVTGPGIEV